jgi:uncharacterized protein with NRDE domain
MCLLAVLFQVVSEAPVVVAANREEAYARGGEPPRIIEGSPRIMAGLDPVAGGTWLGVNERGLLVAVTNRKKSTLPAQPRSRGLLARELLVNPTAADAAAQALAELRTGQFAGCNILCVDHKNAFVTHGADRLEQIQLSPGIHVLTARDVDDMDESRLAYAMTWLNGRSWPSVTKCVSDLRELCSQNGDGVPPMVLRGRDGGTVSSSIVALTYDTNTFVYLHAQGPPDVTAFQDYSTLLQQL